MSAGEKIKNFLWKLKENKKVVIPVAVVIVLAIAVVVGAVIFGGEKTISGQSGQGGVRNSQSGSKLTELPRVIDGVWVRAGRENFLPVAIMIENLVSSRPQAGLDKANLVYEVLVEGGITRFLAVFASGEDVKKIGPVRSARAYYLDWAKELNAVYAHIGGSPEALRLVPQYDILDLNQFYNSQYFWRASERPAPHNLYTSGELLARAVRDKKWDQTGKYDSWKYQKKENPASIAKTLTLDFSTYNYRVEYKYDPEENDFVRYLAGAEQVMEEGGKIRVKNVIVQFVKTRLGDSEGRLNIETTGEGEARIYRDGQETLGTWKKTTRESRTLYYDVAGKEIELNRGTTWVEVIPTDRTVTFE